MASSKLARGYQVFGASALAAALLSVSSPATTQASPPPVPAGVDLSTYVRVGRFDLPEPTRTAAPANNLLAQEASAVTYDWDTDTLFVCGDGGTAVTQVSKSGALINTMTLAQGGSSQGTEFYDTEGLTYVGNGKFVMTEERDRQAVLFTYAAGTTLTRAQTQTVKLGTSVGNIGLEGVSYDPQTSGFVFAKEVSPQGIFQTTIDFPAGTASNGSPSTDNSDNLFDPSLMNLLDLADVYALSNLPSLGGRADSTHLLVLSQESGKIVNVDRSGTIFSTLTIQLDPGNPLSIAGHNHEGLTMDRDGNLYVVNENGGGDSNHPQLWVYAPSSGVNLAPTALTLTNQASSKAENTNTASRVKVADVVITDDGLGTNNLSVTGADAASFEVDSTGLYIKAGTSLDYETKTSYSITVQVDDPAVGASPDATAPYNLAVTDVVNETSTLPQLLITEVVAWGNNNTTYNADWFEVTNVGGTAADITGWKMDDDSNGSAQVALSGVGSIEPGQSAIFVETASDATLDTFKSVWFGIHVPAGFKIGRYSGSGVGLGTGGDSVNLFDAAGNRVTGVHFASTTTAAQFRSLDNAAGIGSTALPLPTISTASTVGVNGAFNAVSQSTTTGSPGRIANHAPISNAGPDQPSAEATGPAGASVSLIGSASFDADGDFLTYAWSEGGSPLATGVGPVIQLALGLHTLTLTVTDPYGTSTFDTVAVMVVDTTPPAIFDNPDGITVEATSAAGAVVNFTHPTSVDLVDGPVTVYPAHPSGSVFPIGQTLNTCTATDAHGNASTSSFRVTVRDTTAPVVTVPADIIVDATGPSGAVVPYTATATDVVGVAVFTCLPPPGATFAIGTTTVSCTATDAAGNSTTGSFTVHVNGPADQLADLLGKVNGVGPGNSLTAKIADAIKKLGKGDAKGASSALSAFINEVGAQAGKKISATQAAALIAQAARITVVLDV